MKGELHLVDTSVWLTVLPSSAPEPLKRRVDALLAADVVATTGVIRLELLGGARTEAEYRRLRGMLSALHLLATAEERWEDAARLGFLLRRQGITVPSTDLLIAAAASHHEAVLVHRDRHFDLLAGHLPLRTESYLPESGSSAPLLR